MSSLVLAALLSLHVAQTEDSPVLVGKSAIIDIYGVGPTAVGPGCYLPSETCIRKAKEIADLKAQVSEFKKQPEAAPVVVVVVAVVAFVTGAAVGGFAFAKLCSVSPSACQ